MATTGTAPRIETKYFPVGPVATIGNDLVTVLMEAPFAGTISGVFYLSNGAKSGANTNSRTFSLANKGAANAGTAAPASLAQVSGVNLAANTRKTITLSSTPADLVVAAGDVLVWSSTHVGNGISDLGGLVAVQFTRGQ